MPNHIINEVIFRNIGSSKRADILLAVAGERAIDFETLLPGPLNLWAGNVNSKIESAFPGTRLDWDRANWGTKWNAYGLDEGSKYKSVEEIEDGLILRFQTAWSPPMGWLVALFNKFKISFEYNWLDQGREDAVCGRFNYVALLHDGPGEPWVERSADNETQRRLHKMLWGVESFDGVET